MALLFFFFSGGEKSVQCGENHYKSITSTSFSTRKLLKAEQQYLIPPSRDKCLQFVQISVDDSEKASGLEITFLQSFSKNVL